MRDEATMVVAEVRVFDFGEDSKEVTDQFEEVTGRVLEVLHVFTLLLQ